MPRNRTGRTAVLNTRISPALKELLNLEAADRNIALALLVEELLTGALLGGRPTRRRRENAMALNKTTLNFASHVEAERWVQQMRDQWVVTGSEITGPHGSTYTGTVTFEVRDGAVVHAPTNQDQ